MVVPLYNRADLTTACVAALDQHNPPGTPTILVDNGSTDATRSMAVAVRNGTNLGFARGCNQGAELAATPVVVFLNNDTEVTADWLSHLVRPFYDRQVGIVGARLVYPNGALQHAGIAVDFTRPPGMEARNITVDLGVGAYDVAAVTGACLAIRTDLFHDLGGFDTGYWNGYEDVDLCLRAAAAGYVIRYQPAAVVTHYESQSGPQRWTHVRQNVARLRERWGGACPII